MMKYNSWNFIRLNSFQVPGYTSEQKLQAEEDLEQKVARLELSGVGGSWGALRIRCEASLFRLYRANSLEVEVRPDTPQPASVLLMGPTASKYDLYLLFILIHKTIGL